MTNKSEVVVDIAKLLQPRVAFLWSNRWQLGNSVCFSTPVAEVWGVSGETGDMSKPAPSTARWGKNYSLL